MCGIIGIIKPQIQPETVQELTISEEIAEMFENQRERGTKGFGIIKVDKNNKVEILRSVHEVKALIDLYKIPENTKMVFMHHRHPTSTPNMKFQTHPIVVSHPDMAYDYYVLHNGIIYTPYETKSEHKKEGFEYTTELIIKDGNTTTYKFNDSECIAIDIARKLEWNKNPISQGSAAIIALQVDKKTKKLIKVHFTRNTNPLNLAYNKNLIKLSSEGPGEEVKDNVLYSMDVENFKIKKTKFEIELYKQTTTYPVAKYDYPGSQTTTPKTYEPTFEYSRDEDIEELIQQAKIDIESEMDKFYEACVDIDELVQLETLQGWLQIGDNVATLIKEYVQKVKSEYEAKVRNGKTEYNDEDKQFNGGVYDKKGALTSLV